MKAIVRDRFGSPDVLELRDVERPSIKSGEVLVRVRATSASPYARIASRHSASAMIGW